MATAPELRSIDDAKRAALLFVDPSNNCLAADGKLWPMVADVANEVGLHDDLRKVVQGVREARVPIFIVPHHRSRPDEFQDWDHPTPYQLGSAKAQVFAEGSWGGEWFTDFAPQPGDTIAAEHWSTSGFANTSLDMLLKQKGITHIIPIDLTANTRIEATGRFASVLGYHVTLVRDATAAMSREAMTGDTMLTLKPTSMRCRQPPS